MGSSIQIDQSAYAGFASEADLIQNDVDNQDASNLQPLINMYAKNIANIKAIEVPQDLVDIHKQQIAIFELVKKILESVRDFQSDPASASAAVDTYAKVNGMLRDMSEKLASKIEKYQQ